MTRASTPFDYIAGKDYGIFSDLAKMQKANILLEQKKNDEAFKLMNEIIEDKSFNPQLRGHDDPETGLL